MNVSVAILLTVSAAVLTASSIAQMFGDLLDPQIWEAYFIQGKLSLTERLHVKYRVGLPGLIRFLRLSLLVTGVWIVVLARRKNLQNTWSESQESRPFNLNIRSVPQYLRSMWTKPQSVLPVLSVFLLLSSLIILDGNALHPYDLPKLALRANIAFKAIQILPGTHRVRFVYDPVWYRRSMELFLGIEALIFLFVTLAVLQPAWLHRGGAADVRSQ